MAQENTVAQMFTDERRETRRMMAAAAIQMVDKGFPHLAAEILRELRRDVWPMHPLAVGAAREVHLLGVDPE